MGLEKSKKSIYINELQYIYLHTYEFCDLSMNISLEILSNILLLKR